MAFTRQRLSVGHHDLHVAVGPCNGPPLVLLHGVTRCWQDFGRVLAELTVRHQVFAVDLRGHGQSDRVSGKYRVVEYVRDITHIVDQLPGRICLVGHSLGAMVGLAVAAERGSRIAGLVLEDPPFETMGRAMHSTTWADLFPGLLAVARASNDLDTAYEQIRNITVTAKGRPRARLGDVREATALRFSAWCLQQLDPGVLEAIVDGGWLDGYNRSAYCVDVRCPTLVLQADTAAGGALTESDARELESALQHGLRVFLPGTGHQVHETQTDAFLRHTLAFLSTVALDNDTTGEA